MHSFDIIVVVNIIELLIYQNKVARGRWKQTVKNFPTHQKKYYQFNIVSPQGEHTTCTHMGICLRKCNTPV